MSKHNIKKKIFSVGFSPDNTHKVLTFCGLKIKMKNNNPIDNLTNIVLKSIDITKLPKATGYIRILQTLEFYMLKEVDRICEKHGISYWLEGGTLLGAVRHKGFIPWDDDLDIAMTAEDFEKFEQIVTEELQNTDFVFQHVPSHIGKILHKKFLPTNNKEMLDFVNWAKTEKLYLGLDIFPYHYIKNEKSDKAFEDLSKARLEKKKLYKKYKNIEDFTKIQKFLDELNWCYTTRIPQDKIYLGLETIDTKIMIFKTSDIFPLKKVEFEGAYFYAPNKYKVLLQEQYDDFMQPVFSHTHINFKYVCKEDKLKLLEHETLEERRLSR